MSSPDSKCAAVACALERENAAFKVRVVPVLSDNYAYLLIDKSSGITAVGMFY
jgi:hypothetical protein